MPEQHCIQVGGHCQDEPGESGKLALAGYFSILDIEFINHSSCGP